MRVDLLPFGVLKDVLSASRLDLPAQTTVAGLLDVLRDQLSSRPASVQLLGRIAVSINAEYAALNQVLREGDQVGLLPPVSGGSGLDSTAHPVKTSLTRDAILTEKIVADTKQRSDGAVVIFDGIVRDNTRGRQTLYLDYEAYEEMAERQLSQIAEDAISRFGIRAVTIIHRLGRLNIGETSVLIVVASAHRGAAFDASRWLIDTLKKTVPIWKKEIFVDGVVWSDGEPFPPELATQSSNRSQSQEHEKTLPEDAALPLASPEAAL